MDLYRLLTLTFAYDNRVFNKNDGRRLEKTAIALQHCLPAIYDKLTKQHNVTNDLAGAICEFLDMSTLIVSSEGVCSFLMFA